MITRYPSYTGARGDIPDPVTHMMSLDFKMWGAMGF